VLLAFSLVAGLSYGASHAPTLASQDEVEPIRSAIQRHEAWTQDAVRHLRADAERRVHEGPWTVTADRPTAGVFDPHDYYSEAPNWGPDPKNPGRPFIRFEGRPPGPPRFSPNRAALQTMSDALFTLSAAGYLLDEQRYAQRAARVVNVWFVNPRTRMNPHFDFAQSVPGRNVHPGAIAEGRPLIRAIEGLEFLEMTGAWDSRDEAAVRRWFEEYQRWLLSHADEVDDLDTAPPMRSWWEAQEAAVAAYLNNTAQLQAAFTRYRTSLFWHRVRSGLAPGSDDLEALAQICRIAQLDGVDLWSVHTRSGVTLASMLDPIVHLPDPDPDQLTALALGSIGLRKPEYLQAFVRAQRGGGSGWSSVLELLVLRADASGHQTHH
jgi:hypothetical protein